jgi:hypothetical protein
MAPFGYSEKQGEAKKTRLDRDLKALEFYLDRISSAVPGAGGITSSLDAVKVVCREVVEDLQDEVERRTEATASSGGGAG